MKKRVDAVARVIKLKEVRRAEILDCAQSLFLEVGFEAATIADILERAGVSKGGFYHHFDSKEALLEALAERNARQFLAEATPGLNAPGATALERLNSLLASARRWNSAKTPHVRVLFSSLVSGSSIALINRINDVARRVVLPVLTEIVEQGAKEGVFRAPDPALSADVLFYLTRTADQRIIAIALAERERGADVDAVVEKLAPSIIAEEILFCQLLGAQPGSVPLLEPGYLRVLVEAIVV